MLKMKHVWAVRRAPVLGACLGMLASVVILTGCSSSSRPPASPAIMTPIEPTATIAAPATVVVVPTEPVATEAAPTEAAPTEVVAEETVEVTPAVSGGTPSPQPAAEEYAVVETSTRYVQAQVDVPVLNAPAEGATEIGLIFDGQTALVTGASPDGAWWRIICADDSIGDCWVVADPTMVQPTEPE